jgi:hypothetical protein
MTVAFWLATGQTVVFLALCGWAFWMVGRIAELQNAADVIKAHTEAASQHATRASLDARAMLDDARDWLVDMREWMASEPDPETEPMRRVGTDTDQAPRVADFAPTPPAQPDPWVAEQMAAINKKLGIDQEPEKPAPRKRTGATAAKKTTAKAAPRETT